LFSILIIFTILFSRLYLGAHSLNQVIYGASLGLAVYLFFYIILKAHKLEPYNFFLLFKRKANIIIFSVFFILIVSVILLVYFLKHNEFLIYEDIFKTICTNIKEYKRFNYSGLYGGAVIYAIAGAYYGMVLSINLLFRKYNLNPEALENVEVPQYNNLMRNISSLDAINNWNKNNSFKNKFFIILVFILCCSLPAILFIIIKDSAPLQIIFIFRIYLPYLLIGFGIWGLTVYLSFNFKIANSQLLKANENLLDNSCMEDLEYRKVEITYQKSEI